jgi:hypothetical protein
MHFHIFADAIPPILLTLSFAWALVTTLSSRWVTRTNWTIDDPAVNQGQLYRSPFVQCQSVLVNANNGSTYYIVECFRDNVPGRSCSPLGGDYPAFCQQLRITGQLLIAGCVFAGLAFLLSWLLLGARILFRHASHDHRHTEGENGATTKLHAWASFSPLQSSATLALFVFSTISAASIAIAALIGGNTLLNLQSPNGEFSYTDEGIDIISGWTWDNGVAYATASWILAAFGAYTVYVVWELPHRGGVYVECEPEAVTSIIADKAQVPVEERDGK